MSSSLVARWRQPVVSVGILVLVGALAGTLVAAALPLSSPSWQRPLVAFLPLLPGLHSTLSAAPDDSGAVALEGQLRTDWDDAVVARHPASSEEWAAPEADVSITWRLPAFVAAWGALLGLLAGVGWQWSAARAPLAWAALVGAGLGLVLALTLPAIGGSWARGWIEGLSSLPGLEAVSGTGRVVVRSSGGVVAETPLPGSAGAVRVTPRVRGWLPFYGFLFALGVASAIAALRAGGWWRPVLPVAYGTALALWVLLAFLPAGAQHAAADGLAAAPGVAVETRDVDRTRLPPPVVLPPGTEEAFGELFGVPPGGVPRAEQRILFGGVELARRPLGAEGPMGRVKLGLALWILAGLALAALAVPVSVVGSSATAARRWGRRRRQLREEETAAAEEDRSIALAEEGPVSPGGSDAADDGIDEIHER